MLDLLGTWSAPDHRTQSAGAGSFHSDPAATTFATPNLPLRVRTILPIPPQIRCYKAAGDIKGRANEASTRIPIVLKHPVPRHLKARGRRILLQRSCLARYRLLLLLPL